MSLELPLSLLRQLQTLIVQTLTATTATINRLLSTEGAAGITGVATLVAGTVTVSTTAVTANSRILATARVVGGTQGILAISAVVAGTSFTITSSNAADTSTVSWLVVN